MVSRRSTRFRRLGTGLAFVVGGALFLVGMVLTPWEAEDEIGAYLDALAAHPTRAQVAPLFLHFGAALFCPAVFGSLALLRGRGAGWGNAAAVLATLGLTTLPGLLVVDWYDLALAQTLPREQAIAVERHIESFPLVFVLFLPALVGAIGAIVAVCVGLWRARVVPAWAAAVTSVAWVGVEFVPGGAWTSGGAIAVMLVGLVGIALPILRMSDDDWERGGPGVAP